MGSAETPQIFSDYKELGVTVPLVEVPLATVFSSPKMPLREIRRVLDRELKRFPDEPSPLAVSLKRLAESLERKRTTPEEVVEQVPSLSVDQVKKYRWRKLREQRNVSERAKDREPLTTFLNNLDQLPSSHRREFISVQMNGFAPAAEMSEIQQRPQETVVFQYPTPIPQPTPVQNEGVLVKAPLGFSPA